MYHERKKVDPLVLDRRRGDEKLRPTFLPNRVLTIVVEGKDLAAQSNLVPLLKGKLTRRGLPMAYICEKRVCKLPTSDPEVFDQQIRQPARRKSCSPTSKL